MRYTKQPLLQPWLSVDRVSLRLRASDAASVPSAQSPRPRSRLIRGHSPCAPALASVVVSIVASTITSAITSIIASVITCSQAVGCFPEERIELAFSCQSLGLSVELDEGGMVAVAGWEEGSPAASNPSLLVSMKCSGDIGQAADVGGATRGRERSAQHRPSHSSRPGDPSLVPGHLLRCEKMRGAEAHPICTARREHTLSRPIATSKNNR